MGLAGRSAYACNKIFDVVHFVHTLSEKAKNLASKEDLGYITQQVEGVKMRHTSEIERLRADLLAEGR